MKQLLQILLAISLLDASDTITTKDRLVTHLDLSNFTHRDPFSWSSGILPDQKLFVYASNDNLFVSSKLNDRFKLGVGWGYYFRNQTVELGDFNQYSDTLRRQVEEELGITDSVYTFYNDISYRNSRSWTTDYLFNDLPNGYFEGYGDEFYWQVNSHISYSRNTLVNSTELFTSFNITPQTALTLSLSPHISNGSFREDSRLVTTFSNAPNPDYDSLKEKYSSIEVDTIVVSTIKPLSDISISTSYSNFGGSATPGITIGKDSSLTLYFRNPIHFNIVTVKGNDVSSNEYPERSIVYNEYEYQKWNNATDSGIFLFKDTTKYLGRDDLQETQFTMSHHLGYVKTSNEYEKLGRIFLPFVANSHTGELFIEHKHDDDSFTFIDPTYRFKAGYRYNSFQKVNVNTKWFTGVNKISQVTAGWYQGEKEKRIVADLDFSVRAFFFKWVTLDIQQQIGGGTLWRKDDDGEISITPMFAPITAVTLGGFYETEKFGFHAGIGDANRTGSQMISSFRGQFRVSAWLNL